MATTGDGGGTTRSARPAAALPKRSRECMARGRGLCSGAGHTCGRAPQTLARETRARYTHVWSHFLVVPLRNPPIAIVRPRIPHSRSYLSRTLPPLALSLAAACAVTCGEGRCPQPSHPCFRVSLARHLNVAPHQLGVTSTKCCVPACPLSKLTSPLKLYRTRIVIVLAWSLIYST